MALASHPHEEGHARHAAQVHEHAERHDDRERGGHRVADEPHHGEDGRLHEEDDHVGLEAELLVEHAGEHVRHEEDGPVGKKRRARLAGGKAQELLQIGRHVAVEHVDRPDAEDEDGHAGEDAGLGKKPELVADAGGFVGRALAGQHGDEQRAGDDRENKARDHDRAPAEGGGQHLSRRGGEHHRDGEGRVDDGHGEGGLLLVDELGQERDAEREQRPRNEAADHARRAHEGKRRRERGEEVAGNEDRGIDKQQREAPEPAGHEREHRRRDGVGDGVEADEAPDLGERGAEGVAELRLDADDRELGAPEREREKDEEADAQLRAARGDGDGGTQGESLQFSRTGRRGTGREALMAPTSVRAVPSLASAAPPAPAGTRSPQVLGKKCPDGP